MVWWWGYAGCVVNGLRLMCLTQFLRFCDFGVVCLCGLHSCLWRCYFLLGVYLVVVACGCVAFGTAVWVGAGVVS